MGQYKKGDQDRFRKANTFGKHLSVIVSFSMPKMLYDKMEEILYGNLYGSRSEFIREGLRQYMLKVEREGTFQVFEDQRVLSEEDPNIDAYSRFVDGN